jgi:type-1 restriction enzyme ecoDI specificity protein
MTNQDSNPSSWLSLELGEVIDYGQTEKIEPDNISSETWVLELEDIERDTSRLLKRLTYAERPSKSTKNSFSPGDILYGKLRPYLNKVIYADASGVCSTEIIPLKPNLAVDSRYLFHWIRHPEFLAYTSQVSHGVNMPRLGTEAGRQAPFILAPINEQRRIADKLDRVLARVDAANEHLSRVAPLIKRFRQSVLATATAGRLTEDWREQNTIKLTETNNEIDSFRTSQLPELPHSWSWKPFSSIARVSSNLQDPSEHTDSIHLAPNHVESWTGRIYGVRTIAEDGVTSPKHKFNTGQIVYSKIRPNLCKVAIPNFSGLCSADMYPIDTDVHVHYLAYWMRSQKFTDWASNAESRTVLPKINQAQLNTLPVPVPSSQEEQSEIVRRVEKLFAFADRLEERLSQAQAAVQKLTPALLAKAFRGELVPQDPNDEPASELLKRLQESRTDSAKPGRARKPRTKKSP